MNLESSTLVLRSINANINVGGFNNDMTFQNINMKSLLGAMYNKYNRFKLILTAFATAPSSVNTTNGIVNIYMEGLNWYQSSYDTSVNANRTRALVGTGEYVTSGRTINYVTEAGYMFDTQQTNVDLRIFITRVTDDTMQATQYSPSIIVFSIYGIDD
jgi:hypothetical protein